MSDCAKCIHCDVCSFWKSVGGIEKHFSNGGCGFFKDHSTITEIPFIAMIEQDLIDGKFAEGKKFQNNNGRYAVVYEDKKKWGLPLIDICGEFPYNKEQAETRLEELKNAKD